MKLLPVFLVLLFGITIASAQTVPIPQVYQPLIPATATPGSQGFTLTVNGTALLPEQSYFGMDRRGLQALCPAPN